MEIMVVMQKKNTNLSLIVKSNDTARIQEAHILLGHYIFNQVEIKILNKKIYDN